MYVDEKKGEPYTYSGIGGHKYLGILGPQIIRTISDFVLGVDMLQIYKS